jgi:hypothetical protein
MAWRAAGAAPRPERGPSARARVSARPPGSPAPGRTPPGAPGSACARPAPECTRTASRTRSPAPRPPLVAVRALRRATPTGRPPHVHDTMETPVRSGCQRAVRPAWIDRAGPARRAAQVSAQDVDTGLPPRGGQRARLGIITGCPQIVPVNPRSRSRRGPNRCSRHQCRRQCRCRRRRNAGRNRDHCRRLNRNRSQYRTRSRCRRHCRAALDVIVSPGRRPGRIPPRRARAGHVPASRIPAGT